VAHEDEVLEVEDDVGDVLGDAGDGGKSVTVRELPLREQIDVPVREQLIVELYSK
jgi:ribosomal protein S4